MKVLDAQSVEIVPGQPIPSIGLLKTFGKADSKLPENFHSLLPSDSSDVSKSSKLTAAAALMARRNSTADAAEKTQGADVVDQESGADLQGDAAGVSGVNGESDADQNAGAVNDAAETQGVDPVDVPEGLDPSDLALDAAAFAAAAQLAQVAAQKTVSADGGAAVSSGATEAQVAIRFFQSACRTSMAVAPVVAETAAVVDPSVPVVSPAPTLPSGETATVVVGAAIVEPGAVPQVPLPSLKIADGKLEIKTETPSNVVSLPEGVSPELVKDLTGNSNLQVNQVVDAVVAYYRGSSVLVEDASTTLVADDSGVPSEGDAAQVSVATTDGTAEPIVVSPEDSGNQSQTTADGDSQQDAAFAQNETSQDVSSEPYTKLLKPVSAPVAQAQPKVVAEVGIEPTAANIAKAYAPVDVEKLKIDPADSSSKTAGEEIPSVEEIKIPSVDLSSSAAPVQGKASVESSQKPVVEGPHHIHDNVQLWKTIADAVQRVRSENPRHLAVELRLGDGSSVGLELRMGAAGIEASFKSDSQGLLKALESQWASFVERAATEPVKVAATVFEGRTGPDLSGSGGDAQERREAFEDSAAAAALSWQAENFSVELPSENAISSVDPSGRLNIYA